MQRMQDALQALEAQRAADVDCQGSAQAGGELAADGCYLPSDAAGAQGAQGGLDAGGEPSSSGAPPLSDEELTRAVIAQALAEHSQRADA